MASKTLLVVAHSPSPNTERLRAAIVAGVKTADLRDLQLIVKTPFEAQASDVLSSDAVILGTTENLGYMSGALKDFFDRVYNPCLEQTRAMPYAAYIRAGLDGTGTSRAITSITSGLGWRAVQLPLILKGDWQDPFVDQCAELGAAMAIGLDSGIF
jgi:hypothetical protein